MARMSHDISRAARLQLRSIVDILAIQWTGMGQTAMARAPKVPLAGVAELVDARDLGSRDESRGGSNPSARTTPKQGT